MQDSFEALHRKALDATAGEPCWCGSGQLFEACHRGREQQAKVPLQTLILRTEATMRKHRRACLHFDAPGACSPDIVRSHTIQRASLERIAEGAHVLGFVPSYPELMKGRHLPQRIGLKVASGMTAFCGKHDTSVFAPIETKPFTASSEQLVVAAYRAVCREVFANEWKVEHLLPMMRELDRGIPVEDQVAFQLRVGVEEAGAVGAAEHFLRTKAVLDSKLMAGDFTGLAYTCVEFAETPMIASVCSRVPAGDFVGKARAGFDTLQDLVPVTFSVLPGEASGTAILSWLGYSPGNESLASSLDALGADELPDALVRFAVSYAEDTYMSPPWWSALPREVCDALVGRMRVRAAADSLVDDGVRAARWRVRKRFSGKS